MIERFEVTITKHEGDYELPWEVLKESRRSDNGLIMGSKNDSYKTRDEAFDEAIRFLTSSSEPMGAEGVCNKSKKIIMAEGIIDVEETNLICLEISSCQCRQLTGLFKTETGASNVAHIEHIIKKLNGRNARITLEFLDEEKPSDTPQVTSDDGGGGPGMSEKLQKEFGDKKPYEGYWHRVDNNTSDPICIHHKIIMIFHPKKLVHYCHLCEMELKEATHAEGGGSNSDL